MYRLAFGSSGLKPVETLISQLDDSTLMRKGLIVALLIIALALAGMTNAQTVNPDEKEIIIEIQIETLYTRHMQFIVKDNGPGFSTKDNTGGMGLGLDICRGICESNGGSLKTGNRKSGGAWVKILLPLNIEKSI